MYILLGISLLSPLLVFFDYRKRSNVYMAIVYVVVFITSIFLFSKTTDTFKLVFAASVPLLMVVFLFVAGSYRPKKRKNTRRTKQDDHRVIDDF